MPMQMDVKRVENRKSPKPSQFSRPRIPAAAPAKHDDRNFTVVSEEFARTLGGYIRCAAASALVDMVARADASCVGMVTCYAQT